MNTSKLNTAEPSVLNQSPPPNPHLNVSPCKCLKNPHERLTPKIDPNRLCHLISRHTANAVLSGWGLLRLPLQQRFRHLVLDIAFRIPVIATSQFRRRCWLLRAEWVLRVQTGTGPVAGVPVAPSLFHPVRRTPPWGHSRLTTGPWE